MSEKKQKNAFVKIFKQLKKNGNLVKPRGQLVLEIENFSYDLPPYVRFQSFDCRKLNLNYIKKEFLWYLKGDRFDTSICEHAKLWNSIKNADGSINSNYGQYIFFGENNQFDRAVQVLESDKDSRRASIVILNSEHILMETNDVCCTYAINFRIRNNILNMTVHMRSQDAIYGMGNDAPAFSFIHEMMHNALLDVYPTLKCGTYHHVADSFHVYEKHFEMLDKLINEEQNDFKKIYCPKISGPEEVKFLRKLDFETIPKQFLFSEWLNSNS